MPPLVSVVTPTYDRAPLLRGALRWFSAQTYPNLEWLIEDDSPAPCPLLAASSDPRIRYRHDPVRRTVGSKRNRLIDAAQGEFIVHFDDDDFYAPDYISTMIGALTSRNADFVSLSSWHLIDLRHNFFGFWALQSTSGLHYHCARDRIDVIAVNEDNQDILGRNDHGFGFSYAYRKSVTGAARFDDVNWCEETGFIESLKQRSAMIGLDDHSGLTLHSLHPQSSSSCFPQFHLPTFLLGRLFPEMTAFLQDLHETDPAAFQAR